MSEEKRKYRLYALTISDETNKIIWDYEFCRVTPEYCLVYTDGEQPAQSVEITPEYYPQLTVADERWLFDCNMQILMAEAATKTPETEKRLNDLISELEKALEDEARKEGTYNAT